MENNTTSPTLTPVPPLLLSLSGSGMHFIMMMNAKCNGVSRALPVCGWGVDGAPTVRGSLELGLRGLRPGPGPGPSSAGWRPSLRRSLGATGVRWGHYGAARDPGDWGEGVGSGAGWGTLGHKASYLRL